MESPISPISLNAIDNSRDSCICTIHLVNPVQCNICSQANATNKIGHQIPNYFAAVILAYAGSSTFVPCEEFCCLPTAYTVLALFRQQMKFSCVGGKTCNQLSACIVVARLRRIWDKSTCRLDCDPPDIGVECWKLAPPRNFFHRLVCRNVFDSTRRSERTCRCSAKS